MSLFGIIILIALFSNGTRWLFGAPYYRGYRPMHSPYHHHHHYGHPMGPGPMGPHYGFGPGPMHHQPMGGGHMGGGHMHGGHMGGGHMGGHMGGHH